MRRNGELTRARALAITRTGAAAVGVLEGALAIAIATAGATAFAGRLEGARAFTAAVARDRGGVDLAGQIARALTLAAARAGALARDAGFAGVGLDRAARLHLTLGLGLDGDVQVRLALRRLIVDLEVTLDVGLDVGADLGRQLSDGRGVDLAGQVDIERRCERADVGVEVRLDTHGRALHVAERLEEAVEPCVTRDADVARGDGAAGSADFVGIGQQPSTRLVFRAAARDHECAQE
jgi:hypothetical protein